VYCKMTRKDNEMKRRIYGINWNLRFFFPFNSMPFTFFP